MTLDFLLGGHCYVDIATWTKNGRYVPIIVHPLKKKKYRQSKNTSIAFAFAQALVPLAGEW